MLLMLVVVAGLGVENKTSQSEENSAAEENINEMSLFVVTE